MSALDQKIKQTIYYQLLVSSQLDESLFHKFTDQISLLQSFCEHPHQLNGTYRVIDEDFRRKIQAILENVPCN